MAKWALINAAGVVHEIIDVDPKGRYHASFNWVPCGNEVKERWTYAGGVFSAPAAPVADKPSSCTPAQGLVALFALKSIKEENILAFIESIADPVKRYTAQVAYSRATEWNKQSATVKLIAEAFKLSDADLDALFVYAVAVQL